MRMKFKGIPSKDIEALRDHYADVFYDCQRKTPQEKICLETMRVLEDLLYPPKETSPEHMLNINSTGKNYRFYIVNGYLFWDGKGWTEDHNKAKPYTKEGNARKAAINIPDAEIEELRVPYTPTPKL